MKTKLLQWKFEARSLLAREPALVLPHMAVIWWTQQKMRGRIDIRECWVGPHTEFVLDGFQGSGNSFATVAFKRSQTKPVMIAHHLHAPAQVLKAIRANLPTLIAIREPAQTVLSLTSRWPYITVQQALRSYIHYYEKLAPHLGSFVLSTFDQTTNHLDEVIRAVNHQFGTSYTPFEHTEENVRALRGSDEESRHKDAQRNKIKAEKSREFETLECRRLLAEAERLYEQMEPYGVGRWPPV